MTEYWACSGLAGKWMFNDKKFTIIHNAINTTQFTYDVNIRKRMRKSLNIHEGQFVVGHVGRFSYQKNHQFVINVFYEICKKNPDAVLLLVGSVVNDCTYWNNAKETIGKLGIEKKVKFLGMRSDVSELMQAMDAFLLPSFFEGLPIVGIEAQAAGLPCFFSDTITYEINLTKLAHFISLDISPEKWAETIMKESKIPRRNMQKEITAAGYDIKQEIEKLEMFYEGN